MLDFAKSIMTGNASGIKEFNTEYDEEIKKNSKVGNSIHEFEEGDYVIYNGKQAVVREIKGQEVVIEQNGRTITTHWTNLDEVGNSKVSNSKTGNSRVGNADPRIASLKAKIKQAPYKDDKGTLKDVYSMADSMVKDLEGRKRQLLDDVHKIEIDLDGWLDLRSELKFMI